MRKYNDMKYELKKRKRNESLDTLNIVYLSVGV